MVDNGDCHVEFDAIKEELGLLIILESGKFFGTCWAVHGAAPRLGFISSLVNVVELEIDCFDVGEFDHALLIICAFPSLRRLCLPTFSITIKLTFQILFSPCRPFTLTTSVLPPPLSCLVLGHIPVPTFISLLHWLSSEESQHVTRLELTLLGGALLYDPLEDLKLVLPAHLRRLEPSVFLEFLDLQNFQSLRILHIEFPLSHPPSSNTFASPFKTMKFY
ncbi:hypothetical protein B0H19DRAFT_1259413 [Mycena capillaripes]|nr:hypothetical protein B0H19DRAFT_1259413 [Mycena capillaripes]